MCRLWDGLIAVAGRMKKESVCVCGGGVATGNGAGGIPWYPQIVMLFKSCEFCFNQPHMSDSCM